MPRFDPIQSLEWSAYTRSDEFARRCSTPDVLALVVSLFSIGAPEGRPERQAVALHVTPMGVRAMVNAYTTFQMISPGDTDLGSLCRHAYCSAVCCQTGTYPVDQWWERVWVSDERQRFTAFCANLVAPFRAHDDLPDKRRNFSLPARDSAPAASE